MADANGSDRLTQIEATLTQLKQVLVQTAERQSVVEHQIELTQQQISSTQTSIRELNKALEIDAENIRRLANVALAHQTRIDSHETRIDDLEGGKAQ